MDGSQPLSTFHTQSPATTTQQSRPLAQTHPPPALFLTMLRVSLFVSSSLKKDSK